MWTTLLLVAVAADPAALQDRSFKITVVDEQTGRGVPLVELETVNHVRHVTDSNGVVAFFEPGLMGQTVFFYVKSHGYEFAKDGFGFRGKALAVKEGGSARLVVKRLNVAERLYRVTGAGIYRDSLLVGQAVPLKEPILNGQVFGSDSVVNAVYRGKVYWFWGDTLRPAYPLGNFHVPGAVSALPADGGLDPDAGVNLQYFLDDKGFAKPTAQMPGAGPTWINGLTVLGRGKEERLFAGYMKVRPPMEVYERGLVEFDDDQKQFKKSAQVDLNSPLYPQGHPFRRTVDGTEYVYFANPYPLTRVKADPAHFTKPETYEAFTCLRAGSRAADGVVERDQGRALYGWKKNTAAVGPAEQARLIQAGKLKPEEALLHLQDVDTGKPVAAHAGSVYWNDYRRRWVMITVQMFGTSLLGEIWYAEADTPLGPWVYARKVVTHDRYSFYNPKQHPMFDKGGGRVIYFEGTYTHTFSGNNEPTPRYDYNQVMYKQDLADERLVLPVPIYSLAGDDADRFGTVRDLKPKEKRPVAFFAMDRPVKGAVAVTVSGQQAPAFYGLRPDAKDRAATAIPLFEFVHQDGKQKAYVVDRSWTKPGYRQSEKPVCLVWRNPIQVDLPSD